jgi:5-methylcytosine-specific restriction endonuclease McrA
MGEYSESRIKISALKKWLRRRGAIMHEAKSSDEILRFEVSVGFGVMHRSNAGRLLANPIADKAICCFQNKQEWSSGIRAHPSAPRPPKRKKRSAAEHLRIVRALIQRDGGCSCAYCGAALTQESATLDHIVPLSRGGPDTPDNMVLACWTCNHVGSDLPAPVKLRELRDLLIRNAAAAVAGDGAPAEPVHEGS